MTWGNDPADGRAYVQCDHEGCTERVYPKHWGADHTEAADIAVARGWYVPTGEGYRPEAVDTLTDYCAAHRPASTVWGLV